MSRNYLAINRSGKREDQIKDAAALPLLVSRVLYLAKQDAAQGRWLRSCRDYYMQAVNWFYRGVTGQPLPFVVIKNGSPETEAGRATYFRVESGTYLKELIRLGVDSDATAAKKLTRSVRRDAEQYLIKAFFEGLSPSERTGSVPSVQRFMDQLEKDGSFSFLMTNPFFEAFCERAPAWAHEARFIEFAKLTKGLCS